MKRSLQDIHRIPANIPFAYFITFRTYGTWLHGDPRGSVDSQHNTYNSPLIPPDDTLLVRDLERLKHPPVGLESQGRDIICTTIAEVCNHRDWHIHAVNVRSNHVHTIASSEFHSPERMMSDFKAWATRHLRESGILPPDIQPWSKHGSTRYVWKADDMAGPLDYVINGQD